MPIIEEAPCPVPSPPIGYHGTSCPIRIQPCSGGVVAVSFIIDVTKAYPRYTLRVKLESRAARLALVGEGASGVRDLLRCVRGADTPDAGRIVVNGTVFFDSELGVDLPCYVRRCVVVDERSRVVGDMSARENVAACISRSYPEATRAGLARRCLKVFGADAWADRPVHRLSPVVRERVELARDLAQGPNVFMFDRPYLDLLPKDRSALHAVLLRFFDASQASVLFGTTSVAEAATLCQELVLLRHGQAEAQGSLDDLMQNPASEHVLRHLGVKNISRARAVGATELEAIDWGMVLHVPVEVPKNVAFVGLPQDAFAPTRREPGSRNAFLMRVARVTDTAFERRVLLTPPNQEARCRLLWSLEKLTCGVAELPHVGDELCLHVDAHKVHMVAR